MQGRHSEEHGWVSQLVDHDRIERPSGQGANAGRAAQRTGVRQLNHFYGVAAPFEPGHYGSIVDVATCELIEAPRHDPCEMECSVLAGCCGYCNFWLQHLP
jgi:hypothetical protein